MSKRTLVLARNLTDFQMYRAEHHDKQLFYINNPNRVAEVVDSKYCTEWEVRRTRDAWRRRNAEKLEQAVSAALARKKRP